MNLQNKSRMRWKLGQPNILLAFDWFDQRIYSGIGRFALEANWHLSPYLFSDRSVPLNWPGDGAITSYGPSLGPFIQSLRIPKVDVSVSKELTRVPRVRVDDAAICRLAADHFLERGFRHFAFYHWPVVEVNCVRAGLFRDDLMAKGVEAANIHLIEQADTSHIGDWEFQERKLLVQLKALPRPLAVFAGQDNLGAALIETCLHNKIAVPEEIAVLGVDNIDFLCTCLAVPLSSIDTRLEELGYQAARQLQRLLDGEITKSEPPVLISPDKIILRRSSDHLAVSHPEVARTLALMHQGLKTSMTVETICEQIGMSKRGLEKAFRTHLRRSPADELRRIRIENAKRLLVESDLKIEAIARECGYSNSSNLSLSFRREAGLTPLAYRRKFRA